MAKIKSEAADSLTEQGAASAYSAENLIQPSSEMALTPIQGAVESPAEVMLDAFCTGLSQRDRRTELISAFYDDCFKKKSLKATESAFDAMWQKFCNTPA